MRRHACPRQPPTRCLARAPLQLELNTFIDDIMLGPYSLLDAEHLDEVGGSTHAGRLGPSENLPAARRHAWPRHPTRRARHPPAAQPWPPHPTPPPACLLQPRARKGRAQLSASHPPLLQHAIGTQFNLGEHPVRVAGMKVRLTGGVSQGNSLQALGLALGAGLAQWLVRVMGSGVRMSAAPICSTICSMHQATLAACCPCTTAATPQLSVLLPRSSLPLPRRCTTEDSCTRGMRGFNLLPPRALPLSCRCTTPPRTPASWRCRPCGAPT